MFWLGLCLTILLCFAHSHSLYHARLQTRLFYGISVLTVLGLYDTLIILVHSNNNNNNNNNKKLIRR